MSCGITVWNMNKKYRPNSRAAEIVEAVKSVSFEITHGEVFGLIGPSGCCKSTIARAIAGLIKPDSGEASFSGRLGFVSQDPYSSLSPVMRVGKIIAEPLKFSEKKYSGEAVREAMLKVRLDYDTFKDRLPRELSGGERQRVSVARALIASSGVLILDEPVSMLDYDVKLEITDILRDLVADSDYAILLISHDISFVRSLATHIAVMRQGVIIEEGVPDKIYSSPQEDLTKKLILASSDLQGYLELSQNS